MILMVGLKGGKILKGDSTLRKGRVRGRPVALTHLRNRTAFPAILGTRKLVQTYHGGREDADRCRLSRATKPQRQ